MRIGSDQNFLSIDLSTLDGGYTTLRAEAVATAFGRKFTASHENLMIDSDDGTRQRFSDFESFKCELVEICFSEGGWLRLHRDSHGRIAVRYRIGCSKASAAMEGEVIVEGEFANEFCRQFDTLLKGHR